MHSSTSTPATMARVLTRFLAVLGSAGGRKGTCFSVRRNWESSSSSSSMVRSDKRLFGSAFSRAAARVRRSSCVKLFTAMKFPGAYPPQCSIYPVFHRFFEKFYAIYPFLWGYGRRLTVRNPVTAESVKDATIHSGTGMEVPAGGRGYAANMWSFGWISISVNVLSAYQRDRP